jgi:preprotein translocase subunit YajC
MMAFSGWTLLAEAAAEAGGEAGAEAEAAQNRSGLSSMLPALLMVMGLFYFLILRPQRQRDSSHRTQLESLKKNDRVVTIGGIYGTVSNIRRESDEVTLKIDEETNAKIRVTMNSIARVITEDDAEGSKAGKT